MPTVAMLLSMIILLQVGSRTTQLLFYAAWERMTAQNPPEANGDLGRELGAPVSTRTMQDGSRLAKVLEVAEGQVPGWAASFGTAYKVGLGMGQIFVNPLH